MDVSITIQKGALDTDLYIKPTAACAYLSPFSCHPPFIVSNIPYSLAFRIRRICSLEADFNKRLDDLREVLLSRGYNKRSIEDSFGRVRLKSRESCLMKVKKDESMDKLTFVTTYDPRIANVGAVVKKHFKTMCLDSQMQEVFKSGIQVGYTQSDFGKVY